jgi:hypothetical protein
VLRGTSVCARSPEPRCAIPDGNVSTVMGFRVFSDPSSAAPQLGVAGSILRKASALATSPPSVGPPLFPTAACASTRLLSRPTGMSRTYARSRVKEQRWQHGVKSTIAGARADLLEKPGFLYGQRLRPPVSAPALLPSLAPDVATGEALDVATGAPSPPIFLGRQPVPPIRCKSAPPMDEAPAAPLSTGGRELRRSKGTPNILKLGSLSLSEVTTSPARIGVRENNSGGMVGRTEGSRSASHAIPLSVSIECSASHAIPLNASIECSGRSHDLGSGSGGCHDLDGRAVSDSLNSSLERGCLADSEGSTADLLRPLRLDAPPAHATRRTPSARTPSARTPSARTPGPQRTGSQGTPGPPSTVRRRQPSFEEALAPRPYLVVACSYPGSPLALRAVEREARAIAAAQPLATTLLENPSCSELRRVLAESDARVLHLTCHGDAPLRGERVPLLMNDVLADEQAKRAFGVMALGIEWWTALLQPIVPRLRVAYLGGCQTIDLGHALHQHAGIASVVCWTSRVADRAAQVFGTAFAAALCSPQPHAANDVYGSAAACAACADDEDELERVRAAFAAASATVLQETEVGCLDNGMRCTVQKYELVDPSDPAVHLCVGCPRQCRVCPWKREGDVCPWAGRLLPSSSQHHAADDASSSGTLAPCPFRGWRGRVAAGVPRLLQSGREDDAAKRVPV